MRPLTPSPRASKRALVLSGGGARGAYQVGVLKALAEDVPPGTSPFHVITGLSVGAINAAVLAEGADDFPRAAAKLEAMWRSLRSSSVYRTDLPSVFRRAGAWALALTAGWAGAAPPKSLLDAEPLARLIRENVDFDRLNAMADGNALDALAITASSYTSGQAVTFFAGSVPTDGWRRARRAGRRVRMTAEHVLASAALPIVFPSVRVEGEWFGDGALREVAPLSPAIHLGCDRLFLIGLRDLKRDEARGAAPYPSMGLIGGQLLDIVFNDQMDADIERSARINRTLHGMTQEGRARTDLRPIGIERVNPSEDVRRLTAEHAHDLPGTVKLVLRAIGAWGEPWVLPSYLTFEPGLIGALIDLGYRDGRARMEGLRAFLGLDGAASEEARDVAAPGLVVDA
jgi:NTE family protein